MANNRYWSTSQQSLAVASVDETVPVGFRKRRKIFVQNLGANDMRIQISANGTDFGENIRINAGTEHEINQRKVQVVKLLQIASLTTEYQIKSQKSPGLQ